jgi:integrase
MRPPLRSARLLDQMRERIRYCHYSLRTEQAYVFWVRRFIRFHRLRHPRSMGSSEVEAFLTHLATERQVAPSTHKQALAALLFLYRQVLDIDLPWMQQIGRPKSPMRIPVVLSRVEIALLLDRVEPTFAPMVGLLYGAGLRLMECLRLRVKDVDFDRKILVTPTCSALPQPAREALSNRCPALIRPCLLPERIPQPDRPVEHQPPRHRFDAIRTEVTFAFELIASLGRRLRQ